VFGAGAGHDDHIECDCGLAQFEVGVHDLARADGRLLNDRSVPDPASAQLHLARAHAELIPAVGVREGAELGPGDVDLDAVHRAFGECVSHLPANRARALGHGARRAHADGDGGARGERRTYRTKRRGHLHLL